MAVAVAPAEQVVAAKAKKQVFVDDDKYYRFTIQLGQACRWRDKGPGQWRHDRQSDVLGEVETTHYKHHAAIHVDSGPLDGRNMNGLIQASNDWIDANKRSERPAGEIQRQLLVYDVVECKPPALSGARGTMLAEMCRAIASETVKAVVSEMKATK